MVANIQNFFSNLFHSLMDKADRKLLNHSVPKAVTSSANSSCYLDAGNIPQEVTLGTGLLTAIKSLEIRTECTVRNSVDDICLESVDDILEGRAAGRKKAQQTGRKELTPQTLQQGQIQNLLQGWNKPMLQCSYTVQMKNSVDDQTQQSVLAAEKTTACCISKGARPGQGGVSFLLLWHGKTIFAGLCTFMSFPEHMHIGAYPARGHKAHDMEEEVGLIGCSQPYKEKPWRNLYRHNLDIFLFCNTCLKISNRFVDRAL